MSSVPIINVVVTIAVPIFIAELTDKDALLLLSLATRYKPWLVFAAGSVAFTITSAIIVTLGRVLISFVPVAWISFAGGLIMICYGTWSIYQTDRNEEETREIERKLAAKASADMASVFLSAVGLLVLLDLAGDATEVLTILFVARFRDVLLVFISAVAALIGATAVETGVGNRLGRVLRPRRVMIFSSLVFWVIGSIAILSALFHF